jgi:hypothetical protein
MDEEAHMTPSPARRAVLRTAAVLLTLAAAAALLPAAAQAQATRTFVSGGDDGDDTFVCSRSEPCRTFAGAIIKTAAKGEINVLSPGGFGPVTITKGITIDATPFIGGVLTNTGNAINVNAGATDEVVLRGLDLNGLCTAASGIRFNSGRALIIENTTFRGFATASIQLTPTTTAPTVLIDNVSISNGCDATPGNGIDAAPTGTLDVAVRDSTIMNSATGVRAADRARVRLTQTTIFANAFGLVSVGSGVIDSCGDNQVFGNGPPGAPTNGIANAVDCNPAAPPPPVAPPPPPPVAPLAPPPPAPPPPPPAPIAAPVQCTVPKLVGLTLAKARTKLTRAHCKLGTVTRRTTRRTTRVGKVLTQSRKAGTKRPAGTKVNVTVGRRPPPPS